MSKIIKKQIKRSLPIMIIFSLISPVLIGLAFNLSFELNQENEFLRWVIDARADSATTTVTVQNAPPAFGGSGFAAESPVSDDTTPSNVGTTTSWTATGNDPEDADFYLLVCQTSGAVATSSGAPACDGGASDQYCVSTATTDETEATCTEDNVLDPGAETDAWYAYVCDAHATEPACSDSYNQGTGASGSPLSINHAPVITLASSTVNNIDPGATTTLTAFADDPDTAAGGDELTLVVCDAAGWSLAVGCTGGSLLCTGTSTDPNVSCDYGVDIPLADNDYPFYVYVYDWHNMITTVGQGTSSTYTVNNVAPSIGSVTFMNSNPFSLNLKLESNRIVYATSTNVVDYNGCTDLDVATASSTFFMTDRAYNCSADDNNCYQKSTAFCTVSGCSGSTATVVCSTTLEHYTTPTDAANSNTNAAYTWLSRITVFDEALSSSATSSGAELLGGEGIHVDDDEITYGTIRAGQDSNTSTASTTVVNYGNTPLNANLSGTNMTQGGNTITAQNQEFSLSAFDYGTGTALATTTQLIDIVVVRPTSLTDVSDLIWWGIGIPGATPSGPYSGLNTFIAVVDNSGAGW